MNRVVQKNKPRLVIKVPKKVDGIFTDDFVIDYCEELENLSAFTRV